MFRIAGKNDMVVSKKRKYRSYSPTMLTNAFLDVTEKGSSVCSAARKYAVPEQTLRDRVKGRIDVDTVRSGPAPMLSEEEEARLVQHIKEMAVVGYGYSRAEVIDLGTEFAIHLGKRDREHPLSLQWYHSFMSRWPDLKLRRPKSLTNLRAKATSETTINNYFEELSKVLDRYGLKNKPECIYNVDEKGIKLDHTPPHIVGPSDITPSAVTSEHSSTTTLIGCGNALGYQIPPYLIFAGQRRREELMTGASPGAAFDVTESGWSNGTIFQQYLEDHFLRYATGRKDGQHILLLYDGHRSHISPFLIDWGISNNVILFVLPPHTSHVLQPMDVGCFGPFEKIYNNQCHKYIREHLGAINRYSVCQLACKSYTLALSPQNLQSAFRRSGIYPFDPSAIDRSFFQAEKVLQAFQVDEDANAVVVQPHDDQRDNDQHVDTGVTKPNFQKDNADADLSNVNFFKGCRPSLIKTPVAKPRRNISKVVSGKAITESDTAKAVKDYVGQSKKPQSIPPKKKGLKSQSAPKKRTPFKPPFRSASTPDTSQNVDQISGPSVSACTVAQHSSDSHPVPGPSHIQRQVITCTSSEDTEFSVDDDDDEKCCVCNKFQPDELRRCVSLVFTTWGQCMFEGCSHWTHLKYCCGVRVLRRHDTFYCPCHGLPCKPTEE